MFRKIRNLNLEKKEYEKCPSNVAILLDIVHSILSDIDVPVLSELGYKYIRFYDPKPDLEIEADKELTQQAIVRLSLFFTIAFILLKLFIGYAETFQISPIEDPLIAWIKSLQVDSIKFAQIIEKHYLQMLLPKLTTEYAKIFCKEKIASFTKDIFGFNTCHLKSELDGIISQEIR